MKRGQRSNDLANASTRGYNAEEPTFSDLLLWNPNTGAAVGSLSMGSRIINAGIDLSQRPLRETGGPLDIALDGHGFLAVSTKSGVRYTRDGRLVIDRDGRMVTATGHLVLGTSGSPITVGQVSAPTQISIDSRGTVKAGTRLIGTLAVMSLKGATKQGDALFNGTPGVRPAGTTVKQGFVEGSRDHRRRGGT